MVKHEPPNSTPTGYEEIAASAAVHRLSPLHLKRAKKKKKNEINGTRGADHASAVCLRWGRRNNEVTKSSS